VSCLQSRVEYDCRFSISSKTEEIKENLDGVRRSQDLPDVN
jgi:hypothetical protein